MARTPVGWEMLADFSEDILACEEDFWNDTESDCSHNDSNGLLQESIDSLSNKGPDVVDQSKDMDENMDSQCAT